jgi:type IV pilus assembly protein PilW
MSVSPLTNMNTCDITRLHPARGERGFTLVELMVAMAIAIFLLGGLGAIVQGIRKENMNQQALAQLQDEQRFAMTVLTDIIQTGGYYPSATGQTAGSALGAAAAPAVAPGQVAMSAGQAFDGFHSAAGYPATPDSLTVRFMTSGSDGVIMCDGSENTAGAGTDVLETNVFTVVPPAGNVPGQLLCSLNGAAPSVPLVNGVQSLEIFYGVNRNAPTVNYNVDTYLTADQMNAGIAAGGDWMNVTSVRIVLTFTNPLCPKPATCQPGQLPTITFERVVPVMARSGVHS